ncbi:hypothetical protein M6B38_376835 [Iris pallida]|uniref:Uncharacterized protein n=1 Tax=Iris pallida TaxID=29817 RepID=A0AAX6GA15_IRIPA|nr:hypothetical protein M6B38_376835 [Iris pallida]
MYNGKKRIQDEDIGTWSSPDEDAFVSLMYAIISASQHAKTEKFAKAQAALEQFSISKCMDVFRKMQDVSSSQRLKALDVLANSAAYREAFLAMDEDFRHAWMASLRSSVPEQFSISKCMDVFRKMQDVPSNQRLKALDVLANSAVYREAFLTMDEDFRHVWMASLRSSD